MSNFEYTPDKEQKIHKSAAIALICKPYRSHENGLPEWAKNSADAYSREQISGARRIIVLLTADRKALGAPAIGCLDFVGTTSAKIEKYFRTWADPEAAAQGIDVEVQGGHGNGGKCYMTQMFSDHALFHTVLGSKGNRYGVEGGSTQFGYVPSPAKGRDYPVPDLKKDLAKALSRFGVSLDSLPAAVKSVIAEAEGFSLVHGEGAKHYESRIAISELVAQVRDHPQMLTTLEYCKVFVLHNGSAVSECSPLCPAVVEPIAGVTADRVISIPETLIYRVNGTQVSTTQGGKTPKGELRLRTSSVSMRWSKKARHAIHYRAKGGFIGTRSMLEIPVTSSYRDKIYGECSLDSLDDYKQNDRGRLADSPLTSAVEEFIAQEIQRYAETFEEQDRKNYSHKERSALSEMNEALDRWKNRFLQEFIGSTFGGGGNPPPPPPLPVGKPVRIEVTCTFNRMALGVAIRPRVRFYDAIGRQIAPVPYRWMSADPNVAWPDDDLMLITSFTPGETEVYAETIDSRIRSNRVPIQVVRLRAVEIEPLEITVSVGSRSQLRAICTLPDGSSANDIALVWTEADSKIARVSSSGMVFGASPGSTEVLAGDDKTTCKSPAVITVREFEGDDDGPGTGKGKGGRGPGRGFPRVKLSDFDPDPDTDEPVHFSSDEPPVCQRVQDTDRNLWWINSAAPLATLYLDKKKGYGHDTQAWRMYHLERFCDVIAQIAHEYDPNLGGPATPKEMYFQRAQKIAEVQREMARHLERFIITGEFPLG